MMLLLISFCAFIASFLTLFSGFGLGTLLMPVVAIFFPVQIAIAITALVHLLNNIFKFILLIKNIRWDVTLKFGLPAIITAIPGAWLLAYLSQLPPIATYSFLNISAKIEIVKVVVGILLIIFGTIEWGSFAKQFSINTKWLPIGGLISGFFGGLSGLQGAFRSSFLLHAGLDKKQFVATNASIATFVDITRITIYGVTFYKVLKLQIEPLSLVIIVLAAFLGAALGVIGLKKVTLTSIQRLVASLLHLLGLLLVLGVI